MDRLRNGQQIRSFDRVHLNSLGDLVPFTMVPSACSINDTVAIEGIRWVLVDGLDSIGRYRSIAKSLQGFKIFEKF